MPAIERSAQYAGAWYPDSAEQCQRAIADFAAGHVPYEGDGPLLGGVVPHAGWVFSGAIAYNTVAELARGVGAVDTVVLFAGHMPPSARPTIMTRGAFWTPLGSIETDEALAAAVAAARPDVQAEGPADHTQDNSFELQLPLIKHAFGDARLVAIGAPPSPASIELAAELLDAASGLGRKLAFVGSTDLTHYGPNYGWAPRGSGAAAERWVREENDPLFIDTVARLEPQPIIDVALEHRNACCPGAVAAAVHCAKQLGASRSSLLRYATSADVHRSASFVGYAGVVF